MADRYRERLALRYAHARSARRWSWFSVLVMVGVGVLVVGVRDVLLVPVFVALAAVALLFETIAEDMMQVPDTEFDSWVARLARLGVHPRVRARDRRRAGCDTTG